jgi:RHS repeat-associated protein
VTELSTGNRYFLSKLVNIPESLGNGLDTTRAYDLVNGLPNWIRTGPSGGSSVQNLNYTWDRVGNLTSRNDAIQSLTEAFAYDNLHRLSSSTLNGSTNLTMGYDQYGNITSKSDVGSYTYGTSRIHAVTAAGSNSYAYDANGNIQTKNGASITWTASNKPKSISNGTYTSTFDYSADDQYWRQIATYANGTETSHYLGGLLEVVNNSSTGITGWRHQVKAAGRTVAVYSRGSNGATNIIYALADHLGSADAITDSAGGVLVRQSYTAFGKRRGSNWTGSPTGAEMQTIADSTRRGFTEHSMLDNLGLVHMNGRVYDPDIGRFLSADPYIQLPDNTQSWNRYSYVFNNPLSFTDPSGYFSFGRLFKGIAKAVTALVKWIAPAFCAAAPGACAFVGAVAATTAAGYLDRALGANGTVQAVAASSVGISFGGAAGTSAGPLPTWGGGQGRPRVPQVGGGAACFSENCTASAQRTVDDLRRRGVIHQDAPMPCLRTYDECRDQAYRDAEIAGEVALVAASAFGIGEALVAARAMFYGVRAWRAERVLSTVVNRTGQVYPQIRNPVTGQLIPYPGNGLTRVPVAGRVPWGSQEKSAFIKEWYSRGLPTPPGGWGRYDIHHIRPREYGGTNDFENLVPVERSIHQTLLNPWWRKY